MAETTDPYEVLGVSSRATPEEIQAAYEQLMLAPAYVGAPDMQEEADEKERINAAYTILSDPTLRALYDLKNPRGFFGRYRSSDEVLSSPPDEEVTLDGYTCRISYEVDNPGYGGMNLLATAYLPLDCYRRHQGERQQPSCLSFVRTFNVVDDQGTVLFGASLWSYLAYDFKRWQRETRSRKFSEELSQYLDIRDSLFDRGLPTAALDALLEEARRLIDRDKYGFRGNRRDQIAGVLAKVKQECDRHQQGGISLLVDCLLDGSIGHPDLAYNAEVIARVEQCSIRSGGFIEPITEEYLRGFYAKLIDGCSTVHDLRDIRLRLEVEDFAPADLLEDEELELAPATVCFQSNKGEVAYDVIYTHLEVEGVTVPVAYVRLPLKVFERHAPEYGKEPAFPELPHGILWACGVEFDGKLLADGIVDLKLTAKVDKMKRARNRSKHAEQCGSVASIFGDTAPTEVPPWYRGKARPGRRR